MGKNCNEKKERNKGTDDCEYCECFEHGATKNKRIKKATNKR